MNVGHKSVRFVFGLGISGLALFWLLSQFDLLAVARSIALLNPLYLFPVSCLILLSFAIRAQRWRLLVEHQPPIRFSSSFSALMLGYLWNNLLPARAGDVVRIFELGRTERISRTKILATLVTERVFDLAATLALAAMVLMSYPALPDWLSKSGILVVLLAGAAIAVLLVAHFTGRRWIGPAVAFCAHRLPEAIGQKVTQMVGSALEGIAGIFRMWRAVYFILLTLLIWFVEVGIVFLIAHSIGVPLAPGNALFVLLFIAIGSMVPSSPGFVGTFEFFGTTGLALIGIKGPTALAFIVLLHIVLLLGSTLIGIVCLLRRNHLYGGKYSEEKIS